MTAQLKKILVFIRKTERNKKGNRNYSSCITHMFSNMKQTRKYPPFH
jgi:hypothetical protein